MARSLVTVMFTDLVGSTQLRSTLGDDQVDMIVARHDATVGELVSSHGGRIIKFLGDGALATFSSAVDATEAASAIQARLEGSDPAVRIGVHAGDVETSADGDIAGLPVAVASRLCGIAPPGGVVVSGLVRSLVGVRGDLRFESLGTPQLKGVTEPVDAWLVGAGASQPETTPGRLPPPVLGRRPAAFVGRHDAIASLDRAFDDLDRQFLVAISGEPGIGKTALVGQWAIGAHAGGATVLVGAAPPEGVAPYQPFIEAIRPLLKLDPAVKPHGLGAANLARLMPELAGTSTGPPLLDDPNTERYVINEAFVGLLASAAGRHGRLVLVLDDLHWADESSIVLLGHLLRHHEAVPVLVVGTYRDTDLDRRHPLAALLRDQRRDRNAVRIDLSGLDPVDVGSLAGSVAGGTPPDAALAVILNETEGNPFFIEEIVEHLISEGMVVDGTWPFDPTVARTIPEGIRETIGRRLDRLTDSAQQLLAAASVIGRSFDVDVLVAVVDSEHTVVERALEEALSANFLTEDRNGEISFSHALIRQTILDEISHLRRTRLHRAVGEALAEGGASPDQLVLHWLEAREYSKALRSSLRAMRDAEAVAAQSAVIKHAGIALELWEEVAPTDRPAEAERHHAIISAGLATAISQGSLYGVEYLRSHRAQLEAVGDERGVGVVLAEEARHLWPLGRVDEALQESRRALELIPAEPPTSERARAEAQLGRLLMLTGSEIEQARVVTRKALETARAANDPFTETAALVTLGVCEPDVAEGEVILRKGLEMATAQNAVFQITRARTNLAEIIAAQGRHDEAIELMSDGLDLVTRLGTKGQSRDWMVANLAFQYDDAERWAEALEVLDTTLEEGYPEAVQLVIQAKISAHQGRFDEARNLVRRTLDDYGHISDIQHQTPLAEAQLWIARWSGDVSSLPSALFDLRYVTAESSVTANYTRHYLLAAAETATAAKEAGVAAVGVDLFDEWAKVAELIAPHPYGESLRATLRAERRRLERADDPASWSEAVRAGVPDTFPTAVATLGWLRSAEALDEDLRHATESALATADRLGATPLATELVRYSQR
ncbi:MAG TPA: AAA family ATPase [Acidimicrobiia bacterium]